MPHSGLTIGLVILGLCIGLLIGLAQVFLKEAWLKVESGFRAGREVMLSKDETTIGRAESCDIGLFGDNAVERTHARIQLKNNQYVLADAETPGGTFLNDKPVRKPTPLRNGDAIRVGNSVLRFGERQKTKGRSPYETGSTMPQVIRCPNCKTPMQVADNSAGKQFRCPSCQKPFTVPAAAARSPSRSARRGRPAPADRRRRRQPASLRSRAGRRSRPPAAALPRRRPTAPPAAARCCPAPSPAWTAAT